MSDLEQEPVERAVIGIDLSPTSSAAVWLPRGWSPGDWSSIKAETFDAEVAGKTGDERIHVAVLALLGFIEAALDPDLRLPVLFVEQYAFSMGNSSRATEQHELGGALKFALAERGASLHPVVASSARKTLFGKLPRMKRAELKKMIRHDLGKMGCELESEDARDALIVANRGRHDLGLPCLAQG